jgi:hypothetical protein
LVNVPVYSAPHTHTHTLTPNQELYIRPHLPRFYHNTLLQCTFCHLMIHDFNQHNCKLPEDGALTPKYFGVV